MRETTNDFNHVTDNTSIMGKIAEDQNETSPILKSSVISTKPSMVNQS